MAIFFDVRGHRYNLLATAQKTRQWRDELPTEADRGVACEALLGHRVDDRVERVHDLQFVGQVRSVQVSVAIIHTTQLPLLFISGLGFGPRFRASGFAPPPPGGIHLKYPMVLAPELPNCTQLHNIRITRHV